MSFLCIITVLGKQSIPNLSLSSCLITAFVKSEPKFLIKLLLIKIKKTLKKKQRVNILRRKFE